MIHHSRIDLRVPYAHKEEAKALGARWDPRLRTWYAAAGVDLRHFDHRWFPDDFRLSDDEQVEPETESFHEPERGISLSELLARAKGVIERGLPDSVWVRAEISELGGKNGNLFPTLTERNERGDPLARVKGVIFRREAANVTTRFIEATGEGLKPDIKILCLARVRFEPLFGLDLIIEDVDPAYTLGDLAAKLARIRRQLAEEGLYDRNRALPTPVEFVQVAIISPSSSAGLGDFRQESDRLQSAGLCDFHYFQATFQGLDAPGSIRTAINEVVAAHRRTPFDALVIIRGGGAVTDLAWLNDLELARLVCRSPIPCFTGIGHERDDTILDEVSHRRFDTPSKVALHITATIRDNALESLANLERIRERLGMVLTRERTALDAQASRIESGVGSALERAAVERENRLAMIRTAAAYRIREAQAASEAGREKLIAEAENLVLEATGDLTRLSSSIIQRTQGCLGSRTAEAERLAQAVVLKAQANLQAAERELVYLRGQADREASRQVVRALDNLEGVRDSVAGGSMALLDAARRAVESETRLVVGMGPQATLRRGFAMARDGAGRPVTSRKAAAQLPSLQIEFHDGRLPVSAHGPETGGQG